MSLAKLIIGIIFLLLIFYIVKQFRNYRTRIQKESELSNLNDESKQLDIEEDIELTRKVNQERRKKLDDFLGSGNSKKSKKEK